VSQSRVAKLLEDGILPCRRIGSHRYIPYADLAAYREQEQTRARKIMQGLTQQSEDLGLYESAE
jgi:hypothetical protein